ncbi:DASH complex, subunit Ask1 [Penicillium griseofulvum]|uniref:DASH complex subunit ASK1 n=1 Tax=Penicillium patulum TaxID=5078 RepID=A0A135LK86_PENPA|nr:DASH complex, subunit Ask1 [Penicillium griseofulvum]KXG49383.1 DASH complex, subunit Ask1 [Penicillium griseofulvum]
MSRQPSQGQRPLSLTEELEKLEQSITLTLQEIDHNFSQAHRIVTTSILPLVEQYTEHSRDVWEGSKFWKQFFEASANVSLSGYEERNTDEETMQDPTATEEELSTDITQSTNLDETVSHETSPYQHHETPRRDQSEDLDLTDLAISSHSTPRAPGHHQQADDVATSSMEYSSSYENLRRQVNESDPPFDLPDSSTLPSTPGRQLFFPRGVSATTPMSSPFLPPASQPQTQDRRYQKTSDPVLHQMLDKTYRVQATPLGKGFRDIGGGTNTRSKFNITTPKPAETTSKYAYDDSPISSPEPEVPQLHSEIFSSPIKGINDTPGTNRKRRTSSNRMRGIPKPGMSVLTPAKKSAGKSAMWDSDDDFDYDDDEDLGPSPPKTMQFHIPQSRLMRTPAREASKRIVTDLLATAGAGDITDDFGDDQSPSVIRRMERLEDETF